MQKSFTQVIEPVLQSIAKDLVHALTYLHSSGVVYCDLKPGNLLIDEYSNVKLCDFGLSQLLVEMVQVDDNTENQRQGNPYYFAPELFEQKGVCSFASDIYALGVVIYELATGKTPFTEENFRRLAYQIKSEAPLKIEGVSADCSNFVMSLLEKNPILRPDWKAVCAHPWWNGVSFIEYDYPVQAHFQRFAKQMGYYDQAAATLKNRKAGQSQALKNDTASPKAIRTGTDTSSTQIKTADKPSSLLSVQPEGLGDEQLLRLSMNVKINMNREQDQKFLDSNDQQQDIKLDKNMTINMGGKSAVLEDITEDQNKSQDISQTESYLSNTLKTQKSIQIKQTEQILLNEEMNSWEIR